MKVTLIDYTGAGFTNPDEYAAALLIFTKSTRLQMSPVIVGDILAWPQEKKLAALKEMANTIPSSWEFVDYTFMIEDVTRAFTHQLVRTRTASFAQQTLRVLDVSEGAGWNYLTGPTIKKNPLMQNAYDLCMDYVAGGYKHMVKYGVATEDARGVLPTNILTNIVMKIDMRNFVDLVRKRSSPRVQGEYREALEQMKHAVAQAHPWISIFIERDKDAAARDLDQEIAILPDAEQRTRMMKLVDIMRKE